MRSLPSVDVAVKNELRRLVFCGRRLENGLFAAHLVRRRQHEIDLLGTRRQSARGNHPALVDQESEWRGVHGVFFRYFEILLENYGKIDREIAGTFLIGAVRTPVDHQDIDGSSPMQSLQLWHDEPAGLAAGLRKDQQELPAGE
jgi:hypothetical protein